MPPKTTLEIIQDIVKDNFGLHPESVKPEAKLMADIGLDSLDLIELAMALEEELNIYIDDSRLPESDYTVQELLNVIDSSKKQII